MEIETKLKFFENLTWIISIALAIVAIISISLIGWIAGIALLGMVLVVIAIILDKDILIPVFIIAVTSTSQIPEQYHHLISYGFSSLLIGYWLFQRVQTKTQLLYMDRSVSIFLFAVVLLSLMSSVFSEYFAQSLFATLRQTFFFIIVYIIYDWIRSEIQIRKIFFALVFIGVVISTPVILQFASSGFTILASSDIIPIRLSGFFTGQTALAMNLSYVLPVTLSIAIYSSKRISRLFLLFFVMIMMVALFLTFSRAEWVSVAISTTILLSTTRLGRRIVLALIFLSASIILFSETVQNMLMIIFRVESVLTHRDVLWKAAWDIFKDHPYLGTGPWTYKEYVYNYTRVVPGTWLSSIVIFSKGGAHNFYLNSAAQLGVGGIIMSISVFVLYFRKFKGALKVSNRTNFRYLLYPCGAIVAGMFGRSFFQSNGIITSGWLSMDIYFWVMFIITLRIGEIGQSDQSARRNEILQRNYFLI